MLVNTRPSALSQSKRYTIKKNRNVASYLYAVVIRVENRLLATGLDCVEETVQCADRLQICRINVVASEPAGRADDTGADACDRI